MTRSRRSVSLHETSGDLQHGKKTRFYSKSENDGKSRGKIGSENDGQNCRKDDNGENGENGYDANLEHSSWLTATGVDGEFASGKKSEVRAGRRGFFFALAPRTLADSPAKSLKFLRATFSAHLHKWQMESLLTSDAEALFFQGSQGPVWILRSKVPGHSALEKTAFAKLRDLAGAVVPQLAPFKLEKLILELHGLTDFEAQGIIVGFELAAYTFQENRDAGAKPRKALPELLLLEGRLSEGDLHQASELGLAVNIARHFTNLPPNDLNPRTYAENLEAIFAHSKTVTAEVWADEKLVDENMNLLLAVGLAAHEGPRLVHLRYRPANAPSAARPIALVGKGVTFDSGGLDIKPASGMRLMKKDMGGSAAAVAVLKWAERTELPLPLDVYVSLAENAIGSRAFRPSDVVIARNGSSVEITNTDAEGRLVLADAMDVAVTQKGDDKPAMIIDIATLTGAIKVGLGGEIAGLFSNNDYLSEVLSEAGLATGDLMWRMPLFQPYRSQLKSNFADQLNCSEGGFGGAITAALFLESFARQVPWAHLDVYAWKDAPSGAWTEAGGSGQPVQALAMALTRLAHEASSASEGELA